MKIRRRSLYTRSVHIENSARQSRLGGESGAARESFVAGPWPPTLLAAILVLLLFPVPGQDDFYITIWPARTLAESGEIVNYAGDRIEQSSALLLTLILAALDTLGGPDPALVARVLSLVCALACLPLAPLALGLRGWTARLCRWLLALFAPFLYWAGSGTEMPIMALLLLAWTWLLRRIRSPRPMSPSAWASLVLIAAAVMSNRPEGGPVWLAVALGFLVLACLPDGPSTPLRFRLVPLLSPLLVGLLVFAALLSWRQAYFGAPWPLPVESKIGVGRGGLPLPSEGGRWRAGLDYLADWNGFGVFGLPLLILVLGAGLGSVLQRARRTAGPTPRDTVPEGLVLAALVAASYLGFTVVSGGDWMEGGRFLVPAAPFFAALGAHGIVSLAEIIPCWNRHWNRRWGSAAWRTALATALLFSSAASVLALALHPKNRALPLWRCGQLDQTPFGHFPWTERSNKAQLRDLPVIDFLDALVPRLRAVAPGRLSFASHQMGFVVHRLSGRHPGALRIIDAAGLAERTLVDCAAIRPRVQRNAGGLWRMGHEYHPSLKVRFLLEDVRDCAGEVPDLDPHHPIDILYELGIPDEALLADFGLSPVFVQRGHFFRRPSLAFVALRRDLLSAADLDGLRTVEYTSEGGSLVIRRSDEPR